MKLLFLATFLLLLVRIATAAAAFVSVSYVKLPIHSAASAGSGQYLVTFPIGSPPQRLPLVIDTSSDLLWSFCSLHRPLHRPHRPHNRHPPIFHSVLASSFRWLPCSDPLCSLPCNLSDSSPCRFHYSYSDRSSSSGLLSLLPSPPFPDLLFGCASDASGASFPPASGVLPLGRGVSSLPSQFRPFLGSSSFSYCLLDFTLAPPPTTFLILGLHPRHNHPRLSFTPLLLNPLSPTFYYISVQAVQIEGAFLPIDPAVFDLDVRTGAGGMVVDSGTTLSFFPEEAYRQVLAAMERRLRLPRVTVSRRTSPEFDLCVNVSGVGGRDLPRMGLRLRGGAVYLPPPRNYFVEAEEGVRCLALQPVVGPGGFGVIGNLMQQGYLLVFDRDLNRLGFSRSGCSA